MEYLQACFTGRPIGKILPKSLKLRGNLTVSISEIAKTYHVVCRIFPVPKSIYSIGVLLCLKSQIQVSKYQNCTKCMNLPNSCFFAVSPCLKSLKKRVPFCQSEDFVTLIGGWPRQAILAWVSKSVYLDVLMLLVFTLDQNAVQPKPIKRFVSQVVHKYLGPGSKINPFIFAI